VDVSDGLFTVELDFGGNVFSGEGRWLQVAVSCDNNPQTILTPRHALLPVPHAQYATDAGSAPWSGLSGVPNGFMDGVDNAGPVNQQCAPGRAVIGFDANGDIICEEPLDFTAGTVFVAPIGSDSNSCLEVTSPCQTITAGLSKSAGGQVVVAQGTYNESIALRDGIDLLGGYNATFTVRDFALYRAIVRDNAYIVLNGGRRCVCGGS